MTDSDRLRILRAGINAYLDGEFENPRRHRPGQCAHGIFYWQPCEACIDAHFLALLKQVI
jgi:hypothetical protein